MRWATVDKALSVAMRRGTAPARLPERRVAAGAASTSCCAARDQPQLQVHLIDLSAEELAADLRAVADLSRSGLYKLLVEKPSQEADGGLHLHLRRLPVRRDAAACRSARRAAWWRRTPARRSSPAINTDPFTDRKEPPHRLVREAFAR
jgi:type VI secretion system protein ImpC